MSSKHAIFTSASREDWMKRIEKDLKGKSIDSMRLYISGIEFPRYAHIEDQIAACDPLALNRNENSWTITSRISVDDPKRANDIALEELQGGAQALRFELNDFSQERTEVLLKNVIPELIEIHWSLTGNVDTDQFSRWWKQWIMNNEPKDHSISQVFARSMYDAISMTLSVIGVDELAKPEKSVNALEDLILLVINELENLGEDISNHEKFSVRLIIPVGHNLLWEISKLRALRILIAHIAYAFDLDERCFIIETTEGKTTTSLGTNDHKIANPVIALACIAGEADAICLPVAEGVEPDKESFHRRIARNVHHLMVNESRMDKVIDPSAGSYFFEELTNNIAKTCWNAVQQKISEV